MSKRERHQLPASSRKRQMRTFASSTPSLSEDAGLEPLRSPSPETSSSSHASRSTTVSTGASQPSSPIRQEESPVVFRRMADSHSGITNSRPDLAKSLSSHFQIPFILSPANSSDHVDQPAITTTAGPPSPVSIEDSTRSLTPTQARPKDALPACQSGDTLIYTQLTISRQQWRLSSSVLARHSAWFKRCFQEKKTSLNEALEEYTFMIGEIDGRVKLVSDRSSDASSASRVSEAASIKVEDEIETAAHEAIVDVYDQTFKAFDGFPPQILVDDIECATEKPSSS